MKILGIETALGKTEVALLDDAQSTPPLTLIDHNLYSESVVSLAQALLERSSLSLREMDGIAVSTGPGSFTGLRIGLSVAKGFAVAADLPLLNISTLDALAASAFLSGQIQDGSEFLTLIDAKRNEFYCCTYRVEASGIISTSGPRLVPVEEVLHSLPPGCRTIVTKEKGKIDRYLKEYLNSSPPELLEAGSVITAAGAVAILGWKKLERGEVADVVSLEPSYLKDFIVQLHH